MTNGRLERRLDEKRVLAVVTIDDASHAVPLARSLMEGGVSAVELTLRTPEAFESLRRIKAETPDMMVVAGTVLRPDQCHELARLGVEFACAPGTNPTVIRAAHSAGITFFPGVASASDIETAVELGCRVLKVFPSEPLGGISYIEKLNAPYEFLDLRYVPLGGLEESSVAEYLSFPPVIAIGGSWIAGRKLIRNQQWEEIKQNAQRVAAIIRRQEGEVRE